MRTHIDHVEPKTIIKHSQITTSPDDDDLMIFYAPELTSNFWRSSRPSKLCVSSLKKRSDSAGGRARQKGQLHRTPQFWGPHAKIKKVLRGTCYSPRVYFHLYSCTYCTLSFILLFLCFVNQYNFFL